MSLPYVCGECGAKDVKLWRIYQTFMENQKLFCVSCAEKDQNLECKLNSPCPSDQIGWLIPAVPTEDGKSFWGYSFVPQEGCDWWDALPLQLEAS